MRHGEYRDDLLLDCSSDDDEMLIARGLSMSIGEWMETFPCHCGDDPETDDGYCHCFDDDGNYVGRR